jgi:hypothetical protein
MPGPHDYQVSASHEATLYELLTLLAQVQTPPDLHTMLAPYRNVESVSRKSRVRTAHVPLAWLKIGSILFYVTSRLLQNLSMVKLDAVRRYLQDLCMSGIGTDYDARRVELLRLLIECDGVARMLLMR